MKLSLCFLSALVFCLVIGPTVMRGQRVYPSAEPLSPVDTEYKSFSAGRQKCGFAPFTGGNDRYRTMTITEEAFGQSYGVSLPGFGYYWFGPATASPGTYDWDMTANWVNSTDARLDYRIYFGYGVDQILATHVVYSGPPNTGSGPDSYSTYFDANDRSRAPEMTSGTDSASGTMTFAPDDLSATEVKTYSTDCVFSDNVTGEFLLEGLTTAVTVSDTYQYQPTAPGWTPGQRNSNLGDLYDTATLEELARADMGACGDVGWGLGTSHSVGAMPPCTTGTAYTSALRGLASDELSIGVRRLQYRFKFQSDKGVSYVAEWDELTTYDDGSEPTRQHMKEVIPGNGDVAYGATHTIEPPTVNGTTVVVNQGIRCDSQCTADAGDCSAFAALGSVKFNLSLGRTTFGQNAGSLWINERRPSVKLATPALLNYATNSDQVDIVLAGGQLQQAKSPQMLANVVIDSPYKYEIQVFTATNTGPKVGGLYTTNGPAYVTWVIENPDASSTVTNRLRITESRPSKSITNDYVWTDASQTWEHTSGNGLRKQSVQTTWSNNNSNRTETWQTMELPSGTVVFKETKKYQLFDWGEGMTEDTLDPDAAALKTTYTYGSTADDSGLVTQITRPNGFWEIYVYSGRKVIYKRTPLLNSAISSGVYRETSYGYTTNHVDGAGDDGTIDIYTPRAMNESFVGRSTYNVILPGQRKHYVGPDHGLWNNPNNLTTIATYLTNGGFSGEISSIQNPDGTMQAFTYATNAAGTLRTNSVLSGAWDGSSVTNGTKTVTVMGVAGEVYSQVVSDVASGLTLDSQTFTLDDQFRPLLITYLDGTTYSMAYDCCGLSAVTNREGIVTTFDYDELKRKIAEHLWIAPGLAVTKLIRYDANGNLVGTTVQGTNGGSILLQGRAFDLAGRLIYETNAVGTVTSHAYSGPDANGQTTVTHTFASGTANAGTAIEVYYRDQALQSRTGTAIHGSRFDYNGTITTETFLAANGNDTSEWHASTLNSYSQVSQEQKLSAAGRLLFQTYSWNNKGQPTGVTSFDSFVWTFMTYSTSGQLEYSGIDLDHSGAVGFNGNDRIARTISDVVADHGTTVRRTRRYVWLTNGVDFGTLVRSTEASVEGLHVWDTLLNQATSRTDTYLVGVGVRWVTNTAPDNSYTVSQFQQGRLVSTAKNDALGAQLSSVSYAYDEFNRQIAVIDAHNGATTFTLDSAGQVTSVTTPVPGPGQSSQTTSNYLDNLGRIWKVGLPDGGAVTNEYFLTGELKKTYGTRTYPVQYAYDYRGRQTNQTTWQNFASGSGAAQTAWILDPYAGQLLYKLYADGRGTTNVYWDSGGTPYGRLATRTWARGSVATYSYNFAGEISTVSYTGSPSTPALSYTYDRGGRLVSVTQGGVTCSLAYNELGQLLGESYSGGMLDNLRVTNNLDGLFRRTAVQALGNSPTTTFSFASYGYDAASRLSSVSDGVNSAQYGYLANSPLVSSITFQQGGATRMTTAKTYDYLNRLVSVSSAPSADAVVSFNYAYNSANQRTSVTNADGTRWDYQNDSLGQLTSGKKYWSDGSIVAGEQFEYSYDDIGNRKTAGSGGDASGQNLRYENYTVNNLNQYSQRTVPGYANILGSANSAATVTVNNQSTSRKGDFYRGELAFDNTAGPIYPAVTNVGVVNNGPGGKDIVTNITGSLFIPQTPEVFSYDADGNLTNDGHWSYTWDCEDRLVNMTGNANVPTPARLKLDFGYDYRDRRVSKVVSAWNGSSYIGQYTNKFLYDGWNLIAELDHTNGLVRSYMWGLDLSGTLRGNAGVGGLLALTVKSDAASYFAGFNGNGDVSALINASTGVLSANYDYGQFGEKLQAFGVAANSNPLGFSSRYADNETSIVYYGRRYLSRGRWLNRDPIAEKGGLNLYGVSGNNAVNRIDPLGKRPVLVFDPNTGLPRYVDTYDIHYLGFDAAATGQQIDRGEASFLPLHQRPLAGLDGESLEMVFGLEASAFMVAAVTLATGPLGIPAEVSDAASEAGRLSVEGSAGEQAFAYARLGVDFLSALFVVRPAAQVVSKLGVPCLRPNIMVSGPGFAAEGGGWMYPRNALLGPMNEEWGGSLPTAPRVFYVTPKGVAVSSETLAGQGSSPLAGNFQGLAGASVNDVITRVPSDWTWGPQRSGQGIVFYDTTGAEGIRMHGPSMNAPAGANSQMGWTLRVMDSAENYFDNMGNVVPYTANEGHIPLSGNPNAP